MAYSIYRGISTPLNELLDKIEQAGWEAGKINFKSGEYAATAKNQHGEKLEVTGQDPQTAAGKLLAQIMRHNTIRTPPPPKSSAWKTTWEPQLQEIADAYLKAADYEGKAASAWKELADDSLKRSEMIQRYVEVEVVVDPDPYPTLDKLSEDVRKRRKLKVTQQMLDHPIWTGDQVLAFRICFDVLGHVAANADFSWSGQNLAVAAYMPHVSESSQLALFGEIIARAAYTTVYRGYAPHKIALFKDFLKDKQAEEQQQGHHGIHPSQSLPPGKVPIIESKTARIEFSDPNHSWESGYEPMTESQNAYLWHGDPIDRPGVEDVARQMHSGWQEPDENGSHDYNLAKHAVVQATRAALLNPQKDLSDNAIHYQDVYSVPVGTADPNTHLEALSNAKQRWNDQLGSLQNQVPTLARSSALNDQDMQQWLQFVAYHRSDLPDDKIHAYALRRLRTMRMDEEYRLQEEHPDLNADQLDEKANKALEKRLKAVLRPSKTPNDPDDRVDIKTAETSVERGNSYPGYAYNSLQSVAQAESHADNLTSAALEDMKNHGGSGWNFRKTALDLGVRGLDPQTTSHAWSLLAPHTSQLAPVDTDTSKWLGYDQSPGHRDNFRLERELQTGRDAAGYGDMPLSQFQMGLSDLKKYGPGLHQDRSALRPLQPTPVESVDWRPELGMSQGLEGNWYDQMAPQWWRQTEAARNDTKTAWSNTVAKQFPEDSSDTAVWPWLPREQQDSPQEGFVGTSKANDELHMGLGIPSDAKNNISDWASKLHWPEDSQIEHPDDYHLTMLYSPQGYNTHKSWAESQPNKNPDVRPTGLNLLPSGDSDYKYAVTLSMDSPELDKWREGLNGSAEEEGIPVSRYPGGFTNHVTLGYANEAPYGEDETQPDSFRTENLSVSQPRLTKVATRSIKEWWDLRKPFSTGDAYWLASMISVGTGSVSRKKAIEFIDDHKDDIEGDPKKFKKEFLKDFDTMTGLHPYLNSRMAALRRTGLTPEEVWADG